MTENNLTVYNVNYTELARNFDYRKPSSDKKERIKIIRQQLKAAGETIQTYCPYSKETDLAKQKLEKTLLWAIESILRE